ncbi:protein lin-37 homolog [Kryptolebias marmoratus]|uniref:Lin-37 DREAM MuvB core complex component n=1 Tax=Kryptolebias marmoratus TaxID=37003 RepID=A0A3Q3GK41_KRYMA|nr:protein lin-37 homolog [Kryptolebias marmoratus]
MHHVKIKTERPDLDNTAARSKLDAVLKGLVEKSENEREPSEGDPGKLSVDSLHKDLSPSSAGKRPSTRFPQHRRKKRKEMDEGGIPETNQHKQNAYIIKLFDRSVDLAQFNTSTSLYPICRAWMRNNPSVREPTASPSSPHSLSEEEVTDMINGKGQNVYRLPPPTSCPVSSSGEPINLRIPQTEKPTVSKLSEVPVSEPLISDHMERWKKIRQKWKECSNKNQLRYSESIKILKEMKDLYDH